MQNKPSISVVIPTYNRAHSLIKAIKSALTQTYPVNEILVCDDGSSDNSKFLVEELKEPKVKWIDCGRNGRPAIPRNIGIARASGEWIAFLDSDDTWLPDKIELQLKALEGKNYKAVCSNAHRLSEGKAVSDYLSYNGSQLRFDDLLPVNLVICSSMMVERDLLKKLKGFPEGETFKAIEDYALWMKVVACSPIGYVNKALLHYTDDPKQSIRANDMDSYRQRKIILEELSAWLAKSDLPDSTTLKSRVDEDMKQLLASHSLVAKTKRFIKRILK